jgi:hypothetical protein
MPQMWGNRQPVNRTRSEQVEAEQDAANQTAVNQGQPEPFPQRHATTATRALDATPVVELVRTEWFTSLVNSGVRACATLQVDLGVIHYDTPKVCITAADLASAYAWLVSILVGGAEANGAQVKGLTKAGIDALSAQLAIARSSSSVPA